MSSSLVILRILYTLGLLGAVVFMPWYVVSVGVLLGMFLFKKYYEALVVLLLLDALYGFEGSMPSQGIYTVVGVVTFMIINRLKKYLAWYS